MHNKINLNIAILNYAIGLPISFQRGKTMAQKGGI